MEVKQGAPRDLRYSLRFMKRKGMEQVKIGKIVNAVGMKGEVKVYPYSRSKERYGQLGSVYVENNKYEIEKVRFNKDIVILKFSEINDRNAAEEAKGKDIYIDEASLPKLPAGEYYIRDMIGLSVVDDTGNLLGCLSDVIQNSAQDLYEVERKDGKKILIPAVEEFILNVDIEKKQIDVKLIEGLNPEL
jgi:16S rRNA processing protein RimM